MEAAGSNDSVDRRQRYARGLYSNSSTVGELSAVERRADIVLHRRQAVLQPSRLETYLADKAGPARALAVSPVTVAVELLVAALVVELSGKK